MENSLTLNKEKPKTESIRQLASRHLYDRNHTTTDEEIRNAFIVLDEKSDAEEEMTARN